MTRKPLPNAGPEKHIFLKQKPRLNVRSMGDTCPCPGSHALASLLGSCLLLIFLVSCQGGYYARPGPLRPGTRVLGYPADELAVEVLSPMYWIGEGDDKYLPPARLYLSPGIYRLAGQADNYAYFAAPGGVGTFFPDANDCRRLSGNRNGGIYMICGQGEHMYRSGSYKRGNVNAYTVGAYVDVGEGWVHHLLSNPHFFQMEGHTWRFADGRPSSMRQPPESPSRPPEVPPPPRGTRPLLEPCSPPTPLLDRPPGSPLLDSQLPD